MAKMGSAGAGHLGLVEDTAMKGRVVSLRKWREGQRSVFSETTPQKMVRARHCLPTLLLIACLM